MTPIEALLLGILIGAGLMAAGRGLHAGELASRDREWLAEVFDNVRYNLHHNDDPAPAPETVDAEVVAEEQASLPIDPDNPPFPRVYHRRPGRPPRFCHCHGRELQDGETVLWWPNPDVDGAFWLVCAPEEETA